jgi:hypothetical protein
MSYFTIAGEEFALLSCGACGIRWLTPKRFDDDKREGGGNFYCPNGHSRVYRDSTTDQLRRERDHLRQQMARVEDEKREAEQKAEAAARALQRHKKRAAAGTCPCCKRTFANMARHMKSQHPNFATPPANVVAMRKAQP